jgi:hypothetical protein
MDRMKPLKEDTAEPKAVETPKPASALTDFLARGLRESQRPPPPVRESQRPSGVVPTSQPPSSAPREEEAAVHSPAESVESPATPDEQPSGALASDESSAMAAVGVASAALSEDLPGDAPMDGVEDDLSPLDETSAAAPVEGDPSQTDYVVPIPIFSRRRIIAGAAATVLLILALSLVFTREKKMPPRTDVPRATPANVHEPLPPAPPPLVEPEEQIPDTEEAEATAAERKAGGAPAPAESGAPPPFGPNVARYPDLPTPVLIQLEKDQEEKATSKGK